MKAIITFGSSKIETYENIKEIIHDGKWEFRIIFNNGEERALDRCVIDSFVITT